MKKKHFRIDRSHLKDTFFKQLILATEYKFGGYYFSICLLVLTLQNKNIYWRILDPFYKFCIMYLQSYLVFLFKLQYQYFFLFLIYVFTSSFIAGTSNFSLKGCISSSFFCNFYVKVKITCFIHIIYER